MAKRLWSAFTDDMERCWLTDQNRYVERHHVFNGAYKAASEKYGYVIPVHKDIHNMRWFSIHENRPFRLAIKQFCQRHFELTHTREEFVEIFGQNFIMDEENDGFEINLLDFEIPPEMISPDLLRRYARREARVLQ